MYWTTVNINTTGNLVLEAFSEKFIQERIKFLKKTGGLAAEDQTLRGMIMRFDQLKMNKRSELERFIKSQIESKTPPFVPSKEVTLPSKQQEEYLAKILANPLQLEFYTFKQLERLNDEFPPPEKKVKVEKNSPPPLQTVFKNDGVIVFYSPDKQGCQQFQAWLRKYNLPKILKLQQEGFPKPAQRGGPYEEGWYHYCIGWVNNNMYTSYRFGRGGSSASMYYVYDNNRPITDEWHEMVIQAQESGDRYLVTNAFNTADEPMTWEQILKIQPKLAGAESIIVFKPFTEQEEIFQAVRHTTPREFDNLNTLAAKKAYIEIPAEHSVLPRQILKESYLKLPADLQHIYVNLRAPMIGITPDRALMSIVKLFDDSDPEEYKNRIAAARKARAENDPNWKKYLSNDEIVNQSKSKATKDYYDKLVVDIVTSMGKPKAR